MSLFDLDFFLSFFCMAGFVVDDKGVSSCRFGGIEAVVGHNEQAIG